MAHSYGFGLEFSEGTLDRNRQTEEAPELMANCHQPEPEQHITDSSKVDMPHRETQTANTVMQQCTRTC